MIAEAIVNRVLAGLRELQVAPNGGTQCRSLYHEGIRHKENDRCDVEYRLATESFSEVISTMNNFQQYRK